jgi:hypothetical protein
MIKKCFNILFLIIFFILKTYSQPIIFLGVKGGLGLTKLLSEGVVGKTSSKLTLNGGLISEFSFISKKTEELSRGTLILEANYHKISFQNQFYRGLEFTNNYKTDLYYAQVPILFRFYTGFLGVKKTGIYANAGLYGAYLFKAWYNGSIIENEIEQTIDYKANDQFLEYDYGISFGGGISMSGFIGVDFRYNLGIPDVYKNDLVSYKNRYWGFFLHLAFPINYHEEIETFE